MAAYMSFGTSLHVLKRNSRNAIKAHYLLYQFKKKIGLCRKPQGKRKPNGKTQN